MMSNTRYSTESKGDKPFSQNFNDLRSRLKSLQSPYNESPTPRHNTKKNTLIPSIPKSKLPNHTQKEFSDSLPHPRRRSLLEVPQSPHANHNDYMKKPNIHQVFNNNIKINIKEIKQDLKEKKKNNDLNISGLKDLFSFSGLKKNSKQIQDLEDENFELKQELNRYKFLFECEKHKYESIKAELLNTRNQFYKNVEGSEADDKIEVSKVIEKNKELYDQILSKSDSLHEKKLEIKELTYQRDQIKNQLRDANDKVTELPEARRHVLVLLNFIQELKTGLKVKTAMDEDYTNSNLYKAELAKLIQNISSKDKAYEGFKEAVKKSNYIQNMIGK